MVKTVNLLAIASSLGMATGCMMLLVRREADKKTNQAAFLKSAIGIMDDQPVIKSLLGGEYQIGRASVTDGFTKLRKKHVQVLIPIKGSNDTACLYAHARRKEEDEIYKLYKLEMTFGKIENKKLILLDLDSVDDVDDILAGVDRKPVEEDVKTKS